MELLPFDEYVASLDRKRNSAAALLYTDDGRVLLVDPSYKPQLDLPGGAVEENEAPWQTMVREVREELGIDRPVGLPLLIDHVLPENGLPEGLAWIFDGGTISDAQVEALILTDPEVKSVGLYGPHDIERYTKPSLAARILVARELAGTGQFALCEAGKRVV